MIEPNRQIVFFIDGGTWSLLDQWIEAGQLPNFSRIKNEGASGKLESVIPTETSFATAAFYLGKNPGRIGIFKFSGMEKTMVTADDFPGKRLWEILSQAGKRSLVMDLPSTWPPRDFNGTQFTGFFTPPNAQDFVYPPARASEFADYPRGGVEILKHLQKGQDLAQLRTVEFEITKKRWETFYRLWTEEAYDLGIFYVKGSDILQHYFWDDHGLLLSFYQMLDAAIGQLFADQTIDMIWILSDHGFDAAPKQSFFINTFLVQSDWLTFKGWKANTIFGRSIKNFLENHRSLASRYYWLRHWLKIDARRVDVAVSQGVAEIIGTEDGENQYAAASIDFERTKVYSGGGQLHGKGIYVNTKLIKNQTERTKLIEQVRAGLLKLKFNGQSAILQIKTGHEVYGDHPNVPDLVFLPIPELFVDIRISSNIFGPRKTASRASGHHLNSLDGIFMAKGSMIRPGHYDDFKLIDVFPTILATFGLRSLAEIDGQVMSDVLNLEKLPQQQDVSVVDEAKDLPEDIIL